MVGIGMRRLPSAALILALALSLALLATSAAHPPRAHVAVKCGEERWPVKTLSDAKVGEVNFAPHDTSIGRLRNRPDPHTKASTPRLYGVETTTFRVKARLRLRHQVAATSGRPT